ncbi:MAG: hypothetical protein GYA33_14630, partial [Thermogutta sp.]|nr:hypothetical protein [Thermogutta sp.]
GDCMLGELLHSVHNQVHHYLSQTTLAHMAGGLHLVSLDGGGSAGNTGRGRSRKSRRDPPLP